MDIYTLHVCVHTHTHTHTEYIYGEMGRFAKSDKMIKISGKVDKPNEIYIDQRSSPSVNSDGTIKDINPVIKKRSHPFKRIFTIKPTTEI